MSRAQVGGNTIVVKPSSDVYTVMAIVGFCAVVAALVILFIRAGAMGIDLFATGK